MITVACCLRLCGFELLDVGKQVDDADGHHCHGTSLADSVAGEAHEQRENRAAKQAHDPSTRAP